MYNGEQVKAVAAGSSVTDGTKHSVSTNPATGLYYKLHVKNVDMSDLKTYRCQAGVDLLFYLMLVLLGMCNYLLVIFGQ